MIYSRGFAPFITHFLQTKVGHSHLLAAKLLRSRFWWCMVRNSNFFLPAFCKLWWEYGAKFKLFLTRFLQTVVGHSHILSAKHFRSRFWWYIVGRSHLLLPAFSNLWSDIHTVLQLNTCAHAFDDVWSEIPTFSNPLFANYGQTVTLSCSQTPPLRLLMIYSRAFAPFITHFLQTMVGHSHLLAAKHLRSLFWWCIVWNSNIFLPAFCKLWSDIHTFLQPNTSAPAFDER